MILWMFFCLSCDPLKVEASFLYHINTEDREKRKTVTRAYFVGGYRHGPNLQTTTYTNFQF